MSENETTDDTVGTLNVDAAFVIFIKDGSPIGTTGAKSILLEHEGQDVIIEEDHPISLDEMWRACTEVAHDVGIMKTTQHVVNGVLQGQMQMARAMAEQQANAQVAAKTGLQVPGRV